MTDKKVKKLDLSFLPAEVQEALSRPPADSDSEDEFVRKPTQQQFPKQQLQQQTAASQSAKPSLLSTLPPPKASIGDVPQTAPAPAPAPAPAAAPAAAVVPSSSSSSSSNSSALLSLAGYGDDDDDDDDDDEGGGGEGGGEEEVQAHYEQRDDPQPQGAGTGTAPAPLFTLSAPQRRTEPVPGVPLAMSGAPASLYGEGAHRPTVAPYQYAEPETVSGSLRLDDAATVGATGVPNSSRAHSKKRQRELEQQLLHGNADASGAQELLNRLALPSLQLDRTTQPEWDAAAYMQDKQNQYAVLASYNVTGTGGAAPSRTANRKHHITALVGAAAQTEVDLVAKKAKR